ncbi:MAG: 7-carboxy-7-deazaguanine synthase QueE [Dysgonamonadaceae bacterium]|jgi:organic radical activating enzyme|nr:7-carboxy-7-deazaguanine synthase QueE [Dysgonamonadaceae bacterium]
MHLNVKEIFYSLQGEGGRQGAASIFIRLTRCNLSCDFCDTDFEGGEPMSVQQIHARLQTFPCQWIVWTGGEPTLQLTEEILQFFHDLGYRQAIESNGSRPLSKLLDYTVVSPKGDVAYARKINPQVDEIRLPVQKHQAISEMESLPAAHHYFLSPVFSEDEVVTQANIAHAVEQVKLNPRWRLSLQIHKLIGIE